MYRGRNDVGGRTAFAEDRGRTQLIGNWHFFVLNNGCNPRIQVPLPAKPSSLVVGKA